MIKEKLSGIFIFISFILTLYSYFFQNDFLIIASLFVWLSFAFIFPTLKDKKILLILMFFSFMAYTICLYNDFKIDYIKVFTVNQYLLTLLIGVVFLRLIAIPKKEKNIVFPKGKNSFIKTYLGVHLFGSVINLSSLILVADKMYKKSPLTNAQIVLLTRSFASDAYWSPFFVSFAAATTYAPNLNTSLIMLNGIILAVFAFVITYIDVTRNKEFDIQNFYGYPLSLENLYLPVILATLVLVTNHFYPDAKVIILVSLFSISMVFVLLPFKTSLNEARKLIKKHILYELPKMKSELSLFLVAGVFGVLVGSILIGLNLSLPFKIFDWQIASILLLIFIFLAFIGVHPIITIAIIGDYLNGVNHTLLALTFLMAWSTTVSTSPFSGLNMTIVARYDFSSKEIFRLNIFYALKMYLICILCLFILSKYLNL
jgi:hypothetical protein